MTSAQERISQTRLHRQLLLRLIESITGGEHEPGSLLPREVDLADRYGVSRGVVREAIRGLEEQGLVSVRHGHGAIVQAPARWEILSEDILPILLRTTESADVLREVIETRRILEVEAASMAATRASEDALSAVRSAYQVMESLVDRPPGPEDDPYLEADLRFHEAVVHATGNRALSGVMAPIHHALLVTRRPLARPEYRKRLALPEHRAVLDAIVARDPVAARSAMTVVFLTIERYLADYEDMREAHDAERRSRR